MQLSSLVALTALLGLALGQTATIVDTVTYNPSAEAGGGSGAGWADVNQVAANGGGAANEGSSGNPAGQNRFLTVDFPAIAAGTFSNVGTIEVSFTWDYSREEEPVFLEDQRIYIGNSGSDTWQFQSVAAQPQVSETGGTFATGGPSWTTAVTDLVTEGVSSRFFWTRNSGTSSSGKVYFDHCVKTVTVTDTVTLLSISPTSGAANDPVTITGAANSFATNGAHSYELVLGALSSTCTVDSATQLSCTVPTGWPGTGVEDVQVEIDNTETTTAIGTIQFGNVCTVPCNPNECQTASCAGATCTLTPKAIDTPCTADADVCTEDICDGAGTCTHPFDASGPCECEDAGDCNDGDSCTQDSCDDSSAVHVCVNTFQLGAGCECDTANIECDDSISCTNDICSNHLCSNSLVANPGVCDCLDTGDCTADSDSCTDLVCQSNVCGNVFNTAIPGCNCENNGDCDDLNVCTTDTCEDAECVHLFTVGAGCECETPSACPTSTVCYEPLCTNFLCGEVLLSCSDDPVCTGVIPPCDASTDTSGDEDESGGGALVAALAVVTTAGLVGGALVAARQRSSGTDGSSPKIEATSAAALLLARKGNNQVRKIKADDKDDNLGKVQALFREERAVTGLAAVLSNKEKTTFARALSTVYESEDKGPELIRLVLKAELEKVSSASDAMRAGSFATTIASLYLRLVGEDYLVSTLKKPVGSIMKGKRDWGAGGARKSVKKELDPRRVSTMSALDRGQSELSGDAEAILDAILLSSPPPHVRNVFTAIRLEFEAKGWDPSGAISALFLSRFVLAAVSVPHKHGLAKSSPGQKTQRSLLLTSKIISAVSSSAKVGQKEDWMAAVDDIVAEKGPPLKEFLKSLSSKGIESVKPVVAEGAVDAALVVLYDLALSNKAEMSSVMGKSKKWAAVTGEETKKWARSTMTSYASVNSFMKDDMWHSHDVDTMKVPDARDQSPVKKRGGRGGGGGGRERGNSAGRPQKGGAGRGRRPSAGRPTPGGRKNSSGAPGARKASTGPPGGRGLARKGSVGAPKAPKTPKDAGVSTVPIRNFGKNKGADWETQSISSAQAPNFGDDFKMEP